MSLAIAHNRWRVWQLLGKPVSQSSPVFAHCGHIFHRAAWVGALSCRRSAHALTYRASMFGLAETQPGASLLSGVLYKPYYLLASGSAAVIVRRLLIVLLYRCLTAAPPLLEIAPRLRFVCTIPGL